MTVNIEGKIKHVGQNACGIKLIKMSKGYNWEIKINEEYFKTFSEMIAEIKRIDQELRETFGTVNKT